MRVKKKNNVAIINGTNRFKGINLNLNYNYILAWVKVLPFNV